MTTKILLVGLSYTGPAIPDTTIDVLGLCRPKVCEAKAAYSLYEYDVILINPESYSHFLFGEATKHSTSNNELWELKAENNNYDLDSAYDALDRSAELTAAIAQGTRVVWLLTPDKRVHFFGWRSVYSGYANERIQRIVNSATKHHKKSKKLTFTPNENPFAAYFQQLQIDGWRMCISDVGEDVAAIAESPEGYCLGGRVTAANSAGWLLTAPTTQDAANKLVQCAIGLNSTSVTSGVYHGIFLSHTSTDKPFVRELKARLESHGVNEVWLDEAEIQIGDSLIKKIDEGLKKTKYIGVVLSPRSINSPWVEKELEIAINREISSGEVVVLPLLYEKCELPAFLRGKLYADFTAPSEYEESLDKLLRRLKVG